MQNSIENFYRSVAQNPALLTKISTGANTPDEFIDRAITVAKDEGYAIDRQEASTWINSQISAKSNGELSDVQLEGVAGGKGAGTAGGAKRPLSSWEQSVADVMLPIDKKITDWFNSW